MIAIPAIQSGTRMMASNRIDVQPVDPIAAAWHDRAPELAKWAYTRLVNRTDAYGAYRRVEDIGREYTLTNGSKGTLGSQLTVRSRVTQALLLRHFRAHDRSEIIGLHTAGRDNLSLGGGLDIDYHGEGSTAPPLNLTAALCWYDELVRRGFLPLLLDSNGRGGFHLRLLLAEAIPADRLFHFFRTVTRDYGRIGFPKPPEQFPKQPDVRRCHKGFGCWLRLPGRHHKGDFWSRVWNGENWIDGYAAIDFMVSLTGDPSDRVPPVPRPTPPVRRRQFNTYNSTPGNLSNRIAAYLRRLPNAGEGGGRDDIAFRFAGFLIRDMALVDDIALDWLCRWDAGNNPPKGRECLAEILKNAHKYAQRPVGSGLTEPQQQNGAVNVTVIPTRRNGHYVLRARKEVY
jgi:hypothetical protein